MEQHLELNYSPLLIIHFFGLTWGLVVWTCLSGNEEVKIHSCLFFFSEPFYYDHVGQLVVLNVICVFLLCVKGPDG